MDDIKQAKYKKAPDESNVSSIEVTFNNSNRKLCVPINTQNTEYNELIEWEKIDGNTIEDAD